MSGAATVLDDGERISQFLQHVRAGCDVQKSCKVTRVPRRSFYDWLERAEHLRANVPREEWTEHDVKVAEFVDAYELARAQSVTSLELVIAQAARSDWRAAEKMLSKLHPEKWGNTARVEVTGEGGGPVQMNVVPVYDMVEPESAVEVWRARAEMGDEQCAALVAAWEQQADSGAS